MKPKNGQLFGKDFGTKFKYIIGWPEQYANPIDLEYPFSFTIYT